MAEIPSLHPTLQGWLLDGPLAAYVPAYVERLERGRYASSTSQRCLNAVAHFAHWMSLCRLQAAKLDESRIDQFLQEHLPHCGCVAPVVRHPREAHAALMPLLAILRQRGVIADLPTASGPIAEELGRYDAYMLDTRGLASGTRSVRLRIIERLLVDKFAGPERVEQYLAERRRLGFELRHKGQALGRFARYVEAVGHRGPLTVDLMVSWARQVKKGQGDRGTSARALHQLRPFMRWLQQFDPATEVPDEATFGPVPGRLTPHIFRDEEIEALLEAAGRIGPPLRGAVMRTLFGLIACTGLRISEALALVDADVDLKVGVLTVRCSKFGKSRLVPLHPSAVAALCAYRRERTKSVPADPEGPFFIATRGRRLGRGISDRQAHRIFDQLRQQLGWVSRGGHGVARIHDLRHSFAVRRLLRWHEQGADVHQHMLALSTYMGHAKVSNTYWYLTGVPELLQLVGRRFEHFVDLWEVEEDGDG